MPNIIKARQYYEKKLAEIVEKEKQLPACRCNNIPDLSINNNATSKFQINYKLMINMK